MDTAQVEKELIATAAPYWEAEAEIPRRFVAGKPGRGDYIRYLRCAVYKELNPAIGYAPPEGYACNLHEEFAKLVDQFPRLHAGADRHAIYQRLHMMTEEFNHYLVLADVLEFALGRPVTDEDVEQMPEDRKLNDLRRKYMESGDPLLRAAMGLTEGGGSRTFGELSKIGGGEIEDRLAAAMKVIWSDEKTHYEEAAHDAAALVSGGDDLARMKAVIAEISLQRVRMRFEQFNAPMPWAEVEAIVGKPAARG
ncbi:MAG: hypothetical protein GEU92_18660 [Alphaproteobacteria bacterium]|nr:hypothetical protein [Alphaproteobacteria bacterium]